MAHFDLKLISHAKNFLKSTITKNIQLILGIIIFLVFFSIVVSVVTVLAQKIIILHAHLQ